jgi:hypothetical protein
VPSPAADGPAFKLLALGADAYGVIAIGGFARGVVAIGINAIGVVAIGVNAVGVLCGVGLNAAGLVGISVVNSIAVLALSLINAIGGFGGGLVNGWVHPVLGLVAGLTMAGIGTRLVGRWGAAARPRLVRLLDVLAGGHGGGGWARARLLSVEQDKVVVGDGDGQHTLEAASAVLGEASAMLARGRRKLLVRVEAELSDQATAETGYRVAAERTAVLRAVELRPEPKRLRLPESREELDWLMRRGLFGGSVVGALGSMAAILVRWM